MIRESKDKYLHMNGLRFHYIESGDDNARPMVLLHGTGDNAHTWSHLVPTISKYFRTLALDQRGHGGSDWAIPPAYGRKDYVSDLDRFVKALHLDGFVLLGHSMGALHAAEYASMAPRKVAGLIHVDIEPCPPSWNKKYLGDLYDTLPDYYETTEDLVHQIQETSPFAQDKLLFHLASLCLCEGTDGRLHTRFDKEVLRHFDQYDLWWNLGNIKCPTLIVRGKESRVMRREKAQQMNKIISESRFEEIPSATHPVHIDNPHAFQKAIFKFLTSVGLVGKH